MITIEQDSVCNRFKMFRYVEAWDQGDEGTSRATNQRDDQYSGIRRIRVRGINCALLAKWHWAKGWKLKL